MVKIPVYLRDMYDAKHLVQIAESCRGDVDLICGRYVVDAKSMLGVFSLPSCTNTQRIKLRCKLSHFLTF